MTPGGETVAHLASLQSPHFWWWFNFLKGCHLKRLRYANTEQEKTKTNGFKHYSNHQKIYINPFCSMTSSVSFKNEVFLSIELYFKMTHWMHAIYIRKELPPLVSHCQPITPTSLTLFLFLPLPFPTIIVHSNSFYAFSRYIVPPSWLMKQVRECSSSSVSGLSATCALLSWKHPAL